MGGFGSGRPGVLRGPYKGGQSCIGEKIEVFLTPNHPFVSMAKSNGYVYRSRLVMAQTLGRPLTETETVHHRNEVEDDDRPDNLRLYEAPGKHSSDHRKKKPHLPNHLNQHLAPNDLFNIRKLRQEGKSRKEIAAIHHVNVSTVSKICLKKGAYGERLCP